MMKRFLALVLALAFALSFAACEEEPRRNRPIKNLTSGEVSVSVDTDEEGSSEVADSEPEISVKTELAVKEQVVVDENGIKITVKGVSLDPENYAPKADVKLLVENTTDMTLSFSVKDFSVNNCMVQEYSTFKIASGKKSNESISFYMEDMEIYGIDVIENIEFYFHIYDSDTYENYLDTFPIKLENTEADGSFAFDETGTVIYEGNGIKMICKGFEEATEYSGPSLVMYVINNTGKLVSVNAKDTSVNGFMVDASYYCSLPNGKSAIDRLVLDGDDMAENGISDIEEIEFYLSVVDTDSWETVFNSDIIKLGF